MMAVLVDVEAIVIGALLNTPAVTALVGTRVFNVVRPGTTRPFVRVVRIGGSPAPGTDRWLDTPTLQVDVWADQKPAATAVLAAVMDALDAARAAHAGGVLTDVTWGTIRYIPDDTFTPPLPRWIADVSVTTHPT